MNANTVIQLWVQCNEFLKNIGVSKKYADGFNEVGKLAELTADAVPSEFYEVGNEVFVYSKSIASLAEQLLGFEAICALERFAKKVVRIFPSLGLDYKRLMAHWLVYFSQEKPEKLLQHVRLAEGALENENLVAAVETIVVKALAPVPKFDEQTIRQKVKAAMLFGVAGLSLLNVTERVIEEGTRTGLMGRALPVYRFKAAESKLFDESRPCRRSDVKKYERARDDVLVLISPEKNAPHYPDQHYESLLNAMVEATGTVSPPRPRAAMAH